MRSLALAFIFTAASAIHVHANDPAGGAAEMAGATLDMAPTTAPAQSGTGTDSVITRSALRGSLSDWTGIQGGIQFGQAWFEDTFPDQAKGAVAGMYIGYNHQIGNVVVGAEADYSYVGDQFDVIPVTIQNASTLRLRAGYAFDNFLVYGTGGLTYVNAEFFGESWGHNYGAGVDYALTDHTSIGVQYLHHVFDNYNETTIDASADVVSVRAGYRF